MNKKTLLATMMVALVTFAAAGCSSNQQIKTTDGRTIVTDGKPEIDNDTGLVSYKDATTGRYSQINRDKISNMSELDN
ncbi:YgdI/YgdR family lipoprotein [Klebsiella variicola]|uniref:YgdI/YgdR family lipoprotein n=1 Tax=Enterobacter hormaechei TaxID=158836 RepID=UPI0020925A54|nr:YgdI/YgdR family lipoprotein [Enterobacter hormaechei]EMB5602917.1 YgdI/YgdR family lipoprotein [Klebsiella pneumoniae]MCO6016743.1 YgdI/YgdR family lipoprotein [Enterobacter hormaechei]